MLVVGMAAYLMLPHDSPSETVATAVGQQRSVTLADESVVTLNTNSIIETRLAADVRSVYLRKGEVYFAVAHDQARPFYVHAGDALVRAVGTAFDVRVRDDARVEVIVAEGRVEVQVAAAAGAGDHVPGQVGAWSAARALDAGEQLAHRAADRRASGQCAGYRGVDGLAAGGGRVRGAAARRGRRGTQPLHGYPLCRYGSAYQGTARWRTIQNG